MPQKQYLSVDPNAGEEPQDGKQYLSTDPNAGEEALSPSAGITTGPNPETPGEMVRRNVGDFADVMLSPIKGLHSLYQDPRGTLSGMKDALIANINKSVAPDAVEKRGQEPKHSLGHDLGIVTSLGATQLPVWRATKALGAGAKGAAGDVPILGRRGFAGGVRKSWAKSGTPAAAPPASYKAGDPRPVGPSAEGFPRSGATPPRPSPPPGPASVIEPHSPNVSGYDPSAPAARPILRVGQGPQTEPYTPNTSGYRAGELLDEGAGNVPHGPQVDPYAPSTSGYRAGEVLDEGAGSIQHPPTPLSQPGADAPVLRKAGEATPPSTAATVSQDQMVGDALEEMLRKSESPTGDLPPQPTITPGGRPSVTSGGQGETQDWAGHSSGKNPPPKPAAPKKATATPAEEAPASTEPSGNAARERALEQALFDQIDTVGSNKMGVPRADINKLDPRLGPRGMPKNELKRIQELVASQTPAERLAYYAKTRNDLFRHEFGREMELQGTPIPD